MSEDCHESNNPRPVVDKSVNLAQQPHDTADVYDEQEPHTAANQELDDLRRKAMGQCLCGYHEDDHEYPALAPSDDVCYPQATLRIGKVHIGGQQQ